MNKEAVGFGAVLLMIGVVAYLFREPGNFGPIIYPFQGLGLALVVIGAIFAALGFFYPFKRMASKV